MQTINRNLILFIATVSSYVHTCNVTAVNVAIPTIGNEFGLSAAMLGWVFSLYVIILGATIIPIGRLADLHGRLRVFKIGLLISAATFYLCTIVQSGTMFLALRGLQGIGAAANVGTGMALVTLVFPHAERGRTMGIVMTAVFLGGATGPSLGGILTSQFGWRSIFHLFAFLSVVMVALVYWKIKRDWAEAQGQHFDFAGAVMLAISMALIMFGFPKLPSILAVGFILVGLAGLMVFVRWEARIASPILDVNLLQSNRAFILSNLANLLNHTLFGVFLLQSNLYLQFVKGYSPQNTGFILLSFSVVMACCANLAGRLTDRFEPQNIAAIGMAFNGMTAVIFSMHNQTTSLLLIIGSMMLFGFGQGIFSTPNAKAVLSSVGRDAVGVATATHGANRSLGIAVGTGISIVLFKLYLGETQIGPENYSQFMASMRMTFIIAAVLSAVGVGCQIAGKA